MKKNLQGSFTRTDKILTVLYKISKGTTKKLRFEDIVVALLKKYPNDFSLRGYPQYPDSEGVMKELYRGKNIKNSGSINYSNKIFSLTDHGISYVEKLTNLNKQNVPLTSNRLSRFAEKEVNRIRSTEGFGLFVLKEFGKITDTDFFSYLGITPRTPKGDFEGRIRTLEEVMMELRSSKVVSSLYERILSYHQFLISGKFAGIIKFYKESK